MNKYALIEYYNSLENKEINWLVAEAEGMRLVHERDGFICYQMNYGGSMKFDPCNIPNDAFPIMLKYGIATISENGVLIGATDNSQEYYEPYGSIMYSYENKNILRAAMTVFLLMKESEKESVETL